MTGSLAPDNPFASPSSLPHDLPPFARIRTEHFAPAIEAGFTEHLAEVDAITANDEPATFTNTIEALERSGRLLDRVLEVFFALTSSDATEEMESLEEEFSPRIAAHYDAISLNSALYSRIRAVFDQREGQDLTQEQRYLVERYELEYRLDGAGLDESGKARLKELNQQLASLDSLFVRNLQGDTNALAVVVDDVGELDGLAESEIAAARAAATEAGLDGKYRITLPLYTGHPWLAQLRNRGLRERIFTASRARGSRGGEHDNRETVLESVRLRAERAELLGFSSHAALVAANSTAGSVAAIDERLATLSGPAVRNAGRELEVLQRLAEEQQRASGADPFALEPWDWAFYAEQVRARDYDVDEAALRPYFEAERVLHDGVFHAAELVYGITFAPREELVAHHPDAQVFEVFDADGSALGLYILDLYTRDIKRGGAWMSTYRQQNELGGESTVVFNVLNVPKPPAGAPTLLTLDEVETLFHEFGHALHGLLAHVTYPHFGGTNVLRDFVEFPSQVNEMWLTHPVVLANYARHYETGEPLPETQREKLKAAGLFNQGFSTTEYLAASVLDMAWHKLSAAEANAVTDVVAFERDALERAGLLVETVPTRYSSTYFQHIFGGGYSAGYYGYIWSEVFDAASVEVFEASDEVRGTGERFRLAILQPGGSRPPQQLVREFLGEDARIEPLLRRRGLTGWG
ncbi:M3 family metallopeptidase [Gulosibacter molinativorax]|uniref:M3 family peptidase n=1 Tax=Gulosibacter molinativorax TaxID=256821 RepID=A0ABT7CC32_9MICO|nr:M3 family metallopeptidase [Gulosibacter molinativorax]MDJ1372181.1 M3 family peptidase [Gulosibacter molinativorax]QUY60948.1 Peptidyl-dipeptidase Dcp [Gulosibacter molinativorax]